MAKCNWTMEEAKKWVAAHKDFTIALESQFELGEEDESQVKEELIKEMALETDKKCEHEWVDITRMGDENKNYLCPECNAIGEEIILPSFGSIPEEKKIIIKSEITEEEKIKEFSKTVDYTSLEFAIKGLTDQVAELKEGRVLSTKNRTLVKDTIEALTKLKERLDELYSATEPPQREEERTAEIEVEKRFTVEKDGEKTDLDKRLAEAAERVFSPDNLKKLLNKSLDEAVETTIKKKMGKVE